MRKEVKIVGNLVFVTIPGEYTELRTNEVTQVKLLAGKLKAKLKDCNNEKNSDKADLVFETNNPEAFSIMLNNMM